LGGAQRLDPIGKRVESVANLSSDRETPLAQRPWKPWLPSFVQNIDVASRQPAERIVRSHLDVRDVLLATALDDDSKLIDSVCELQMNLIIVRQSDQDVSRIWGALGLTQIDTV